MPTLPASPADIAIAVAMAFVGAFVQGSIGFGLAVVSAPILLIVNPAFLPGPMLMAAMLLVMLMAASEWAEVLFSDVKLAVMGRVVGTVPAAYAMSVLPRTAYELLFAMLVMVGVGLSALGWHIPRTSRNVLIAAILSGFAGTVSSVGGPPMALVYQYERGPRIRATLSAIFTLGTLISLVGLWWAGRFGRVEFVLGAILLPGVCAGYVVSRFARGWVDRARTRPAILAVSAASATVILVRAMAGLL